MESQQAPPPPPPPTQTEPEATVAPEPEDDQPKKKKHSFWRELPVLVVIAFVVALLIKTFLLQAFYIPSASMEPTLVEGDRVLVEKVSYRFGGPARGQVVVFEKEFAAFAPEEDDPFWEDIASALKGLFGFPTGGTQDFIKRVMAVEGDTIEGRDGRVYVNGEVVEEPYLAEGTETSAFGPTDIPDDMIFVMGDNRSNSDDSRAFGPIPVEEVVGHAFLLLWPPSDFDTL
ncbi:MAG: signal peptidase I [Actinomycetota bacterium]|nr:signal peptidase I [Actinomycetota bacterium]